MVTRDCQDKIKGQANDNCRQSRMKKMYLLEMRRERMLANPERKAQLKELEEDLLRHSKIFRESIYAIRDELLQLRAERQIRGLRTMMDMGLVPQYDCYHLEEHQTWGFMKLIGAKSMIMEGRWKTNSTIYSGH